MYIYRDINLEYGMKILFPCTPVMLVPILGIAITSSSDAKVMIEMEVCKYWESDTDANQYKVTLKPIKEKDKLRYGFEKLYSSDLKSLICQNICNIIE